MPSVAATKTEALFKYNITLSEESIFFTGPDHWSESTDLTRSPNIDILTWQCIIESAWQDKKKGIWRCSSMDCVQKMSPSLQKNKQTKKTSRRLFEKDPVEACPCPSEPQNALLWLTIQNTAFAICSATSTCTSPASEKSPRGPVMSPFSCLSRFPVFGRLAADWLRLQLHFPTLA